MNAPSDDPLRSVLVVGAGVGGSVCAIRLRQLGVPVTIAEKDAFPRDKVCGCCLGGAGLKALERVELRDWIVRRGVTTRRWIASLGERRIELSLPDGVAISRPTLDAGLLDVARSLGANVLQPARVTLDDVCDRRVDVTIQEKAKRQSQPFGLVVMAGGLNSVGLNQFLPWRVSPHGPFGVSMRAEIPEVDPGVIYMACDDDGYVGMVRLEDDSVDVAAAITSGAGSAKAGTPKERVEAILRRSRFGEITLHSNSKIMTTPPLRRTRQAGTGRLLAIGDAAGYVEPFTGEGMTWAASSAVEAAELIAAADSRRDGWNTLGEHWDRQSRSLLRRKKLACRTITGALRSGMTRRVAGWALSHWPALARPLINDLSQ